MLDILLATTLLLLSNVTPTQTYTTYLPTVSTPPRAYTTYLPSIAAEYPYPCPTTSTQQYDLIPFFGPMIDHPHDQHGDLNLALRGYKRVDLPLTPILYDGDTDPHAPQLTGLFADHRIPSLVAVHRPNHWLWDCRDSPHGCRGAPITPTEAHPWEATIGTFRTRREEPIFIPGRGPDIRQGGYKALVLYAAQGRLTIGYTHDDSVAEDSAIMR